MAQIQAGRNCILHPSDLLTRAPLCNGSATWRSACKLGLYSPICQWSLINNWKNVTQRDGAILAQEEGGWKHKCTILFCFSNFDVQLHQERKATELNEGHFHMKMILRIFLSFCNQQNYLHCCTNWFCILLVHCGKWMDKKINIQYNFKPWAPLNSTYLN
jgi:hypothetical protein